MTNIQIFQISFNDFRYFHFGTYFHLSSFQNKVFMYVLKQYSILSSACTTATEHKFAFEFDLVMDFMAIFSNKQAEVSTGEKMYDTAVYEVWKKIVWSKHTVKLWQHVEYPTGWMSLAWHSFDHHLNKDKQLSTASMRWLLNPQQKTNSLSMSIHSTILYH